jgi:hypothetical protein
VNIAAAFKGAYVSAVELGEKAPTLTIDHVKMVELEGEDGKVKPKPVCYFKETDRGWVMCKTTALCVAAMFGNETDAWHGKRVTLFATDVQVGKERKPGIRVRGSPDITAPVSFDLKLPKRRAQRVVLEPTAGKGAP